MIFFSIFEIKISFFSKICHKTQNCKLQIDKFIFYDQSLYFDVIVDYLSIEKSDFNLALRCAHSENHDFLDFSRFFKTKIDFFP